MLVSARLCTHRLRGWDGNRELHFILGNRTVLFQRYLLDRLTTSELVRVIAHPSYWDHTDRDRAIARQELELRARGAFECASMGQLPLPSVLLQLIGQFHSSAITPARPVHLHPPSYLAAVTAIQAELSADSVTGHARAASQLFALDAARKKQRHE